MFFKFCVRKTHKNEIRQSDAQDDPTNETPQAPSIVSSQGPLPTERKLKDRGNKIVVGTAVKAKIGELEEEVRVGSARRMRK